MSHRSSGNSLNVSENMGVVSKTSTPLSGSLENLGGGELLRKNFGGANSTSSQRCVLKEFRSMTNSLTDCVVSTLLIFKKVATSALCILIIIGNSKLNTLTIYRDCNDNMNKTQKHQVQECSQMLL